MNHLLCLGLGYSAAALVSRLDRTLWEISGTATSPEGVERLKRQGIEAIRYDGSAPSFAIRGRIATATHLILSAPPGAAGDPLLAQHARDVAEAGNLKWIGYLSTIGVYGDHQGAWVDETTPAHPKSERSRRRVVAETQWLDLARHTGKRVQVFRLAGIYGPGRNQIESVRNGTARRIVRPGQIFNRIHVDDIATALLAGMAGRGSHAVYNITDDEPAPPEDVLTFIARLTGSPPPPEVPLTEAGLSDMALSFYAESKRVRNDRMKSDLGVALAYPTYREGMRALIAG